PVEVIRDYQTTGLSLKNHPLAFLRDKLTALGARPSRDIRDARVSPHGSRGRVAGLALFRQRPGTAKGVIFVTLEDETGRADLILRPHIAQRFRNIAFFSTAMIATGRVERQGRVVHLLVDGLADLDDTLRDMPMLSRDFR
ncbi:MAG: hypothetical protein KDA32_02280, partial [Phycisphaerales bacterium]|nr:hypothetical protein [Phycisphaerales bacterium]